MQIPDMTIGDKSNSALFGMHRRGERAMRLNRLVFPRLILGRGFSVVTPVYTDRPSVNFA